MAHAWYIPPAAYSMEAPFPPYLAEQIEEEGQRRLEAALREARDAGVMHGSVRLLAGVPWAKIVEELERRPYDLCVIGTQGRTGLARMLIGSVAAKVVRHAPCSVLTVRPEDEAKPYSHALVPTDFSPYARYAVDIAPHFVAPGGTLTLLHVMEVPIAYAGEVQLAEFARIIDQHAAAALDTEAKRLAAATSLSISTRTRMGYPGAETLAAIDAYPTIDLVVLGSHGRTGIKRVLLGSVAEKVVRHSRCSVLVARRRTDDVLTAD